MSLAEQSIALVDDSVQPPGGWGGGNCCLDFVWKMCWFLLPFRHRTGQGLLHVSMRRMIVTPNPILSPSARQQTRNCHTSAYVCTRNSASNRIMFGFLISATNLSFPFFFSRSHWKKKIKQMLSGKLQKLLFIVWLFRSGCLTHQKS